MVLVMIGVVFGSPDPTLEPGQAPAEPAGAWFFAGFLALLLAVEKWFTIHHCRRFVREFIPTQ